MEYKVANSNFFNILNGFIQLHEYQFYVEKEFDYVNEIWNKYFAKAKKIVYNINEKMYNVGLSWDDYLVIMATSLYDSIYSYNATLKVPFIAFFIVRLKSDVYKHIREQLKVGNRAMNQAVLVDWQHEEFKQPLTKSPLEIYLNEYKERIYLDLILTTKTLNETERYEILSRVTKSKPTRKMENSMLTKNERQRKDNIYQRGKSKLSKKNVKT